MTGLMGAGAWGLARAAPAATVSVPFATWIAAALTVLGFTVALAGVLAFRRHHTTVDPVHPERTSALVTSGIYRHTRNPMYLGFVLVLIGWIAFLGNLLALAAVPALVYALTALQIRPEERALRRQFEANFDAYANNVRRWI